MNTFNKKFLADKSRTQLKKYVISYLLNYFKFSRIYLPEPFIERVGKEIDTILNIYINFSLPQNLRSNFDLLTLGEIDLKKILGLDNSISLIKRSLEITFELIVEEEPAEIISDFLKSKDKFLILIQFCYRRYIVNSVKKKFPFLVKLSSEKREIIIDKIMYEVFDNYDYYMTYESSKSKFKTFLYKDIILRSIKVFREENLNYYYFVLSKNSFEEFVAKYSIELTRNDEIAQWQIKTFSSRNELSNWLEYEIEENSFQKFGKYIWLYVKSIETFINNLEYLDEIYHTSENKFGYLEDETIYLPESTQKLFFERLSGIEKDPVFRLILKITLGININYLNSEIDRVFNKSINLDLIKKLHELLLLSGLELKTNFYNRVYLLLREKSSNFSMISVDSIQRRVNRNLKKIKEIYKMYEFKDVILFFAKNIEKDLFLNPPVFLKISDAKDIELLYDRGFTRKLKILDLSNCLLDKIPEAIFKIKSLEEINLSNNMLEKISEGFKNLENLKLLNIKNQIKNMNQSFSSSVSYTHFSDEEIVFYKNILQNCEIII